MLKKLISRANWPTIVGYVLALTAAVLLTIIAFCPKEEVHDAMSQNDTIEESFLDAGFKVQQKARLEGAQDWDSTGVSDVEVGEVVQFQTEYQNWSERIQEHVVMSLSWAEGLEFVPGSVILYSVTYPDGDSVPDPALTYYEDGGAGFEVDLGTYVPGANVYLRFSAVVTEADAIGSACFADVKNGDVTLGSATAIEFTETAKR